MNPGLCGMAMQKLADVLLDLGRYPEAHEVAAEFVTYAKAKLESVMTLIAVKTDAVAKVGRVEEAKANFKVALTTAFRIYGRDHPYTRTIRNDALRCKLPGP